MPELAPQGRRLGMSGYSATMIWGACLQQVNTQKGLTKPFLYKFYKYLQIFTNMTRDSLGGASLLSDALLSPSSGNEVF